ncbi:5-(carboxyamino)imidazole ribonucleotide mutase [Collibacillus ludicampi]|uniref:N5-carboxyaminoimidazole ribonucleotide mutase n=1 Tax=Collibacillus ludicampi TaxID=2771369 RepID=A0AAV4LCH9_9BACL|nr:5-(carboxyamino)imidazole ribonucleotide mutase [Collibacillus ludicampi]GIM45473.1 5-(carboxyamino)imidazole ribonucleotide mutase [Collibacillus ludicampi]
MNKKVLIVMGSDSDLPIMQEAAKALEKMGVPSEIRISSAHRVPDKTAQLAREAEQNGFAVIIAGAGLAAHLPGVIAAHTTLPVIGVPIQGGAIQGVDALYAIVQMPQGIPVATVAINGAYNAGLLAAQIIATSDAEVAAKLKAHREEMAKKVEEKDAKLQDLGASAYIKEVLKR